MGFTLIELVVVIALLSILAAAALPRMMKSYDGAHESSVTATGGALASAVILVRSQWVSNGARGAIDSVTGYGDDGIAFNLLDPAHSTASLQASLNGILSGNTVTITGNGSDDSPWEFVFTNPAQVLEIVNGGTAVDTSATYTRIDINASIETQDNLLRQGFVWPADAVELEFTYGGTLVGTLNVVGLSNEERATAIEALFSGDVSVTIPALAADPWQMVFHETTPSALTLHAVKVQSNRVQASFADDDPSQLLTIANTTVETQLWYGDDSLIIDAATTELSLKTALEAFSSLSDANIDVTKTVGGTDTVWDIILTPVADPNTTFGKFFYAKVDASNRAVATSLIPINNSLQTVSANDLRTVWYGSQGVDIDFSGSAESIATALTSLATIREDIHR